MKDIKYFYKVYTPYNASNCSEKNRSGTFFILKKTFRK